MGNGENDKRFDDRLAGLEAEIKKLKKRGGMLSGGRIRKCVLTGEDADEYLKYFERRQWAEMSEWWKKKEGNKNGWKKKIIIKDFNELNVTPFSYDLSMGGQVFSIQSPKDGVKPLSVEKPYSMQPGETVVVITAEKVAIPHAYSATVWPRFNMVKRGVFQSMVKIDPTWHGHLAIAMSNLSPAIVELNYGKAFATLLFYELSKESDVDLWKLEDIQKRGIEVVEEIPKEFIGDLGRIDDHIFESESLRGYCCVRNQSLVAWGIKREHVEALKDCLADERWYALVDRLSKKWAVKVYAETKKRMIVMPALGMYDLWNIVGGLSENGYIRKEDVLREPLAKDSLVEAAVRYGKAFEAVARIPDAIVKRIEDETIPKIEAEIESKIQMRVIILVFSLFGFISLVLTILGMLWRIGGEKFIEKFSNSPGLYATMTTIGGIFGIAILLLTCTWLTKQKKGRRREERKLEKQHAEVERREKELKKREEKFDNKFRKWENKQVEKMKSFEKSMKKSLSESKMKKDEQSET